MFDIFCLRRESAKNATTQTATIKKHEHPIPILLVSSRGCPTLLRVRGGIGHPEGDLEGRVTTAEYDVAFVVNVYTPNAGAGLKRLRFRTSEWDETFAAYVRRLEETKPVVVVGELSVICFYGVTAESTGEVPAL